MTSRCNKVDAVRFQVEFTFTKGQGCVNFVILTYVGSGTEGTGFLGGAGAVTAFLGGSGTGFPWTGGDGLETGFP